jgi:hypothetical protein
VGSESQRCRRGRRRNSARKESEIAPRRGVARAALREVVDAVAVVDVEFPNSSAWAAVIAAELRSQLKRAGLQLAAHHRRMLAMHRWRCCL